jgi:transcriptional regulator with XRE-family HTH domain
MGEFSIFKQVSEVSLEIASRLKLKRKKLNFTQSRLAKNAGISLGSLQRFEQTGEISLISLLKISNVLESLEDFDNIFEEKEELDKKIEKLFE